MWVPGKAYTVVPGEGRQVKLGHVTMRVLAADDGEPGGAFSLTEFSGEPGAWTVPHLHRTFEESFFVLDGAFTFTVGDEAIDAVPGTYVLVPRGTAHTSLPTTTAEASSRSRCREATSACSSNLARYRRMRSPTSQCAAKSPPATTPSPSQARSDLEGRPVTRPTGPVGSSAQIAACPRGSARPERLIWTDIAHAHWERTLFRNDGSRAVCSR